MINGSASTGFVIRDEQARVKSMKGEQVHCSSVVGAEANAARRGITEAIRLKIKDLIIEGDNFCVINALKAMLHGYRYGDTTRGYANSQNRIRGHGDTAT